VFAKLEYLILNHRFRSIPAGKIQPEIRIRFSGAGVQKKQGFVAPDFRREPEIRNPFGCGGQKKQGFAASP